MPVILILFVFWLLSFFLPVEKLAVSTGSPWWTFFTYSFVHVCFLHLAVNSIVFWTYYRIIRKSEIIFIVPLCIAVPALSAIMACSDAPTCGFSAVISTLMGYYLSGCSRTVFFKSLSLVVFSYVFTGLFAEGINTLIHVYSFTGSFVLSIIYRLVLSCCRSRK